MQLCAYSDYCNCVWMNFPPFLLLHMEFFLVRSKAQWEGVVLKEFSDGFGGGSTMMERTLRPQEETVGALVPLEMRVTAGLCATQLL